MKRIIVMLVAVCAVAVAATACLNSSDDFVGSEYALVSVVDGDASTGEYLIFDDGRRVSIASGIQFVEGIPASKYYPSKETGEARAEISYRTNKTTAIGFDKTINITALSAIDIKRVDDGLPTDIDTYDANVSAIYGVSYAREKYLNIFMEFDCSGQNALARHLFKLVYNPEKTGFYSTAYTNDNYLYLELYHDDDNDTVAYRGGKYVSFYITDELLSLDISSFRGIKILYRKDGLPTVAQFEF